jgi:crossover junction endodeoxyribonuclease RusA
VSEPIRLTLPLPPSANSYWRNLNGRTLLSAGGRAYKRHCHLIATAQMRGPMEGELEVVGTVYMARRGCDLDNRIKPLLDGMEGAVFDNDKQVARIDLTRAVDSGNPRVEVIIRAMEAA